MKLIEHFVGGKIIPGASDKKSKVFNPATGEQEKEVKLASKADLDQAVNVAQKAFEEWSLKPALQRARIMFKFKELIEKNSDELTKLIVTEHGKVYEDAKGSLTRGLEVVEFACGIPNLLKGEFSENVGTNVDSWSMRQPLGVVAGITPFNFPAMVPMWMFPIAIACGNTFILKPSEKDPSCPIRLAELLKEAGLPDGVFNIVNGGKEVVEAICDHPEIKAVSFVGSTKVAKIVYKRATSNLKRCVALGGAKNHLLVLPDANPQMTASNVVASMSGCAGQRCMAASVMVGVDNIQHIIDKMVEDAKKLVPGDTLGSVISSEAKKRIEDYITQAENDGAKIILDGRNITVKGKEGGYYVGPTIIDHVTPEMSVAKEEIFGPVISIIRAKDLDEAIEIENGSNYGNAAAVFTRSGGLAKQVIQRASAGMIGVNIGVPVPREPFSFGGWNESKFGVCDITGRGSIEFWTQNKKTTTKWNPEAQTNWMS